MAYACVLQCVHGGKSHGTCRDDILCVLAKDLGRSVVGRPTEVLFPTTQDTTA